MTQILDAITPPTQTLELSCGKLEIKPIVVKRLSAFTKAVNPFFGALQGGENEQLDLASIVINYADNVIEACALAANVHIDTVGELDAAELLKLTQAVIEVNLDFFIKAVTPQLSSTMQALVAKMQTMQQTAGQLPSAS